MDSPRVSTGPKLSRTVKLGPSSIRTELPTAAERRTNQAKESLVDSDYEDDVRDTRGGAFAREKGPQKDELRPQILDTPTLADWFTIFIIKYPTCSLTMRSGTSHTIARTSRRCALISSATISTEQHPLWCSTSLIASA